MSMIKSFGLATIGATAGMIGGNYLYNLDKKANKYKEVPVPFYTVRRVANDISNETKKMVDDIKVKCQQPKQEEVFTQEVHQMTDEEVAQELEQPQIHVVTDEEVAEELNNNNQQVIDTEVVDGKAVPVDVEGNPINRMNRISRKIRKLKL